MNYGVYGRFTTNQSSPGSGVNRSAENGGATSLGRPPNSYSVVDLTDVPDKFTVTVHLQVEIERVNSKQQNEIIKLRLPMVKVSWSPHFPEIDETIISTLKKVKGALPKSNSELGTYYMIPPSNHDSIAAFLSSLRPRAANPVDYQRELSLRIEAARVAGLPLPTSLPPGIVPEVLVELVVIREQPRAVIRAFEPWNRLQEYYRLIQAGKQAPISLISQYIADASNEEGSKPQPQPSLANRIAPINPISSIIPNAQTSSTQTPSDAIGPSLTNDQSEFVNKSLKRLEEAERVLKSKLITLRSQVEQAKKIYESAAKSNQQQEMIRRKALWMKTQNEYKASLKRLEDIEGTRDRLQKKLSAHEEVVPVAPTTTRSMPPPPNVFQVVPNLPFSTPKPNHNNPSVVTIVRDVLPQSSGQPIDTNLMLETGLNDEALSIMRPIQPMIPSNVSDLTIEDHQNLMMRADALKQIISTKKRLSQEDIDDYISQFIPGGERLSLISSLVEFLKNVMNAMSRFVHVDRSLLAGPWPNLRKTLAMLQERQENVRQRAAAKALRSVSDSSYMNTLVLASSEKSLNLPKGNYVRDYDDIVGEVSVSSEWDKPSPTSLTTLEDIELEEWDGSEDYYDSHNFEHLLEKKIEAGTTVLGHKVPISCTTGVPKKLYEALYGFQKAGVDFVATHEGRALIGDEMGCGKTLQAIAAACMYRYQWPLLVVCPASLKMNWLQECFRWCGDFLRAESVFIIDSSKNSVPLVPKGSEQIYITTYTIAPLVMDKLMSANIGVLIADESHYIKNPKAKRTKAMTELIRNTPRAILLSGTPIISRPAEIFEQVSALRPSVFGSARQFNSTFGHDTKMGQRVSRVHLERLRGLYKLLRKTVMIRRLKKQVLKFLQPKMRTTIRTKTTKSSVILQAAMKFAPDLKKMFEERSRRGGMFEGLPEQKATPQSTRDSLSWQSPNLGTLQRFENSMGDTSKHGSSRSGIMNSNSTYPMVNNSFSNSSTRPPDRVSGNEDDDDDDDAGDWDWDDETDDQEDILNRLEAIQKQAKKRGFGGVKNQDRRWLATVMYRESGKVKVPYVKEYIADMIDAGPKFLVFAHHYVVLDAIEEVCKEKGISYIRIDGRTKPVLRSQYVDEFQSSPRVKVAILGITSAGLGLTLTAADIVVFAELYWTPAALLQAEDRVHRVGQPNAVNIYYIIAQDTIDEMLWALLETKLSLLSHSLDGRGDDAFAQARDDTREDSISALRPAITFDSNSVEILDVDETDSGSKEKKERNLHFDLTEPSPRSEYTADSVVEKVDVIEPITRKQSSDNRGEELLRQWEAIHKGGSTTRESRVRKTGIAGLLDSNSESSLQKRSDDRSLTLLKKAKFDMNKIAGDCEEDGEEEEDISEIEIRGVPGLKPKPRQNSKLNLHVKPTLSIHSIRNDQNEQDRTSNGYTTAEDELVIVETTIPDDDYNSHYVYENGHRAYDGIGPFGQSNQNSTAVSATHDIHNFSPVNTQSSSQYLRTTLIPSSMGSSPPATLNDAESIEFASSVIRPTVLTPLPAPLDSFATPTNSPQVRAGNQPESASSNHHDLYVSQVNAPSQYNVATEQEEVQEEVQEDEEEFPDYEELDEPPLLEGVSSAYNLFNSELRRTAREDEVHESDDGDHGGGD